MTNFLSVRRKLGSIPSLKLVIISLPSVHTEIKIMSLSTIFNLHYHFTFDTAPIDLWAGMTSVQFCNVVIKDLATALKLSKKRVDWL